MKMVYNYHLEFTHHIGTKVGKSPTPDNLLVFYISDAYEWFKLSASMTRAGFKKVKSDKFKHQSSRRVRLSMCLP